MPGSRQPELDPEAVDRLSSSRGGQVCGRILRTSRSFLKPADKRGRPIWWAVPWCARKQDVLAQHHLDIALDEDDRTDRFGVCAPNGALGNGAGYAHARTTVRSCRAGFVQQHGAVVMIEVI